SGGAGWETAVSSRHGSRVATAARDGGADMRIGKWMVVGALASAALLFPACSDTNRGVDTGLRNDTGMGGAGDVGMMEDQGIGGSGGTKGTKSTKGAHGTMAGDAGTTGPTDAGTGGAGDVGMDQDVGTSGQGVTGDEGADPTRTESGGVPVK
ncbi:MAG TPA: hypothetical protein VF794_12155, partial [Archangium sp.]